MTRKQHAGPATAIAAAIAALLLLAGCGGADNTDTPPEPTATTMTTATALPTAVSTVEDQNITVSAPDGSAASGDVTLSIPKDALPEGVSPSDVKIENIGAEDLAVSIEDADVVAAYRLLPDGLVLSEPATVSLQLPAASLSGDLLLVHLTAEGLSPIDDLKVTIDDAGKVATLEATITHFSDLTAIQARFFDIGLGLTEHVYKVGESFPVTVVVRSTGRGWGLQQFQKGIVTVKAAQPMLLFGFWTGKAPALLPNLVDERPSISLFEGSYTNTQMFTCAEEASVSVVYRENLSYFLEQQALADDGSRAARHIPGGGGEIAIFEQETVDCVLVPPIEAKYDENYTTTYSIDVDPAAGYRFGWSGPNCGSTSGTDQPVMSWVHGDEDNKVCKHAVDEHEDAIISVLVVAPDGREWRCTRKGSATGTGELCEEQK